MPVGQESSDGITSAQLNYGRPCSRKGGHYDY